MNRTGKAYIAIQAATGIYDYITVYRKGDIEHTGRLLKRCYRTKKKAGELLQKGNIAFLEATLERTKQEPNRLKSFQRVSDFQLLNSALSQGVDYVYTFERGRWVATIPNGKEVEIP